VAGPLVRPLRAVSTLLAPLATVRPLLPLVIGAPSEAPVAVTMSVPALTVVPPLCTFAPPRLSVPLPRQLGYMIELRHALEAAGHATFFAAKSQVELHFDVGRIGRHVAQTPADAWVVGTGTHAVLEWFAAQALPSLALFGRRSGLPIAAVGPDKVPAFVEATRQLMNLGHRRIVLLCRRLRRLPAPGRVERAFLAELAAHGLRVGAYNLPDWEETLAGFHACLAALFRHSRPTALIIDEAPFFAATQQFLARRNLQVPAHVSLVRTDHDPTFGWCEPVISHMHWDSPPVIRRIVRWAAAVSHGRTDRVQTLFPAQFISGGTIGPAPAGERAEKLKCR